MQVYFFIRPSFVDVKMEKKKKVEPKTSSSFKKTKTKKNKTNFTNVIGWLIICVLYLLIGFIFGMAYQQVLITNEISSVLSYTDLEVNINFNATKFAQELNDTFIPSWRAAFNETLQKQLTVKNCSQDLTGENC